MVSVALPHVAGHPPAKMRRLTLSSLPTRTSVHSFSISSMVTIMTMLCHRSGDSKCLPNLAEDTTVRRAPRARRLGHVSGPGLTQAGQPHLVWPETARLEGGTELGAERLGRPGQQDQPPQPGPLQITLGLLQMPHPTDRVSKGS